jgi:hypothetical protein
MTHIGENIKDVRYDKSNFECLMERDFPNSFTARIVEVEILPAEKGSVNLFVRSKCATGDPCKWKRLFL